jgi:hypothetical protein
MSPERKAARKEERRLAKLPSIARQCKAFVGPGGIHQIVVDLDGAKLAGTEEQVNAILERMNLKPIRTTQNLLNPDAGLLVIDIDTPLCCDVGSETYWTM